MTLDFHSMELSALKVKNLSLTKILRRSALEPIVLGCKVALGVIALIFLVLTIHSVIKNLLLANKSIGDLDQNVQQSKEKLLPQKESAVKAVNYRIISDKSIFGTLAQSNAQPATPQTKPAVKTSFNLIGTFITQNEAPYAIIEDEKKKVQEVFSIGESVFGEAKLLSVHEDRVEIDRSGERETLIIDDTPTKGDAKGISSDGDHFIVEEGELDRALENLPLLLTQARAVPYFRDGKATGLRLFAVKSGSLYEKLGLKNGDILKAINGTSLADLSQAMQLFEKLKSERSITVNLERSSEDKEFRYDIR